MSSGRSVVVECPRCGSMGKAIVWDSINVVLSPRLKEELLAGKLNRFHCDCCGFETCVSANLLYHDMELDFIAQFYPFERTDQDQFFSEFTANAQFDLQGTGMEDGASAYFLNPHIVFSMDELIRYVIFRDKLAQHKSVHLWSDGRA